MYRYYQVIIAFYGRQEVNTVTSTDKKEIARIENTFSIAG